MGLQDYTYRLKAQSGDSTPHDELAVSGDLSGGTISLVDMGIGDYAWQFSGGVSTATGPSKAVTGATNGTGVTIAARIEITSYGSTDYTELFGYRPAGGTINSGIALSDNSANNVRARYKTEATANYSGFGTSIKTVVLRLNTSSTSSQDFLKLWVEQVSRAGTDPDSTSTGQNASNVTLAEIFAGNSDGTIRISDLVIWGEELSDADCAALADDGIRATLDASGPTLTSPTGTATGQTTASGTVETDEGNGTLYYLATTNSTESAATVKGGSSQAVTATGSQSVSVTGLTAGTGYYLHYVHRDAAGNDSTVASSSLFTTDAAPVVVKGVRIQLHDGTTEQASLTGLTVAWFDDDDPATFGAPVLQSAAETTDASGWLEVDLDGYTALDVGDPGFLIVYKAGATAPDDIVFAGRLAIEDIAE